MRLRFTPSAHWLKVPTKLRKIKRRRSATPFVNRPLGKRELLIYLREIRYDTKAVDADRQTDDRQSESLSQSDKILGYDPDIG